MVYRAARLLVLFTVWLVRGHGQPTDARAESRSEHPLAGGKEVTRKPGTCPGAERRTPAARPVVSSGTRGRGLRHRQGKGTTQKVAARTRERTALGAHGGESEEPIVSTAALGTGESRGGGTRKVEGN